MFTMPHKQQISICIQHQCATCPETGTGLGGIEVGGDGVVGGIQRQLISRSIQQAGNTGEEGVCFAIATTAVGKEKDGITIQLKYTIFQVSNRSSISIINSQGILAAQ